MSEAIGQLTLTLPCKPAEEVIVEVFGLYQNDKQKLALYQDDKKLSELLLKEQKAQTCIFSTQNACEYELEKCYLALEIQGEQGPLVVPLSAPGSVKTTQYQAKRQINLINSVLPATHMPTSDNEELLVPCREGYLYLFHQGKLWREVQLLTPDNQWLFKDVDVAHWRQSSAENKDLRQPVAECDALWFPNALEENDYADLCIAYSEVQWSWERIQYLEANPEAITQRCQPLSPSIYAWFDKGGEDFVRAFSELEDVRPRCEDAELMFSQPEELMRDLSGAILGQRAKQTIQHTELNNKFQALEPSFYLRQLVQEVQKAEDKEAEPLPELPEVSAVTSAWENGKKFKLAALIVEDPIFDVRYHSVQYQDTNECLKQLNLLSSLQPYTASARLLNSHILPSQYLNGDTNPRYKFTKDIDLSDQGLANQTLFISARRTLRERSLIHSEYLQEQIQQTRAGAYLHQLRDFFSLNGADYAAGFVEVGNVAGALQSSPENSDGLMRPDEKRGNTWLKPNVQAFARLLENGVTKMLAGEEETAAYPAGSGDFRPDLYTKVNNPEWEMWQEFNTAQADVVAATSLYIKEAHSGLGKNDKLGLLRATTNGFTGVLDSILAMYLLSLKSEFGATEPVAFKVKRLYALEKLYNLGPYWASGFKVSVQKTKLKGAELPIIAVVDTADALPSGTQMTPGYFAGKGLQVVDDMGSVVASPSLQHVLKNSAQTADELGEFEHLYVVANKAAGQLVDGDGNSVKPSKVAQLGETLVAKPYLLPSAIFIFDIWNLDVALEGMLKNDTLFSDVSFVSALFDLSISSTALAKAAGANNSFIRAVSHQYHFTTRAGIGSISRLAIAGAAAGLLTAGLQAWNGLNLLKADDDDAATAQFIQATGTLLTVAGPLAASLLGFSMLTPIGIVGGLALIIGGGIAMALSTDTQVERWLKAGPFSSTGNGQHQPHLDDPIRAYHSLCFELLDGETRRISFSQGLEITEEEWQILGVPVKQGNYTLAKLQSPILALGDMSTAPEFCLEQTLMQGAFTGPNSGHIYKPYKTLRTHIFAQKWVQVGDKAEYWWLIEGETGVPNGQPAGNLYRIENKAFARIDIKLNAASENYDSLAFPVPNPEQDWESDAGNTPFTDDKLVSQKADDWLKSDEVEQDVKDAQNRLNWWWTS